MQGLVILHVSTLTEAEAAECVEEQRAELLASAERSVAGLDLSSMGKEILAFLRARAAARRAGLECEKRPVPIRRLAEEPRECVADRAPVRFYNYGRWDH